MKFLVFTLLCFFAEVTADVTFRVDNVSATRSYFYHVPLKRILHEQNEWKVVHVETNKPENCGFVSVQDPFNSLVAAIQEAYANHRSLILTPDYIWITILQGVGIHQSVTPKAERCYDFDNASDLGDLTCNKSQWPQTLSEAWCKLDVNLPGNVVSPSQTFSTTTVQAKIAALVALAKPYEEIAAYGKMTYCGIPNITLKGEPADWVLLKQKVVSLLSKCHLRWWLCALEPVLDQFIATSKGSVQTDFWKNIYQFNPDRPEGSGCWQASGWIVTLYPYTLSNSRGSYVPNRLLPSICSGPDAGFDWTAKPSPGCPIVSPSQSIGTFEFPPGLARSHFNCTSSEDKMGLVGGFLGICEHSDSGALEPVLGWYLTDEADMCHMMGDECKDDCACSGHGKCTAGQGIGDFFGFGFGLGDSDDKTCQCDPGWTGHDCSQRCPGSLCGQFCGEFCNQDEACDYFKGHCVPVEESSMIPMDTSPGENEVLSLTETPTNMPPNVFKEPCQEDKTSVPPVTSSIQISTTTQSPPTSSKSSTVVSTIKPTTSSITGKTTTQSTGEVSTSQSAKPTSEPALNDSINGTSSNIDICEDVEKLREIFGNHSVAAVVTIASINELENEIKGKFSMECHAKTGELNLRRLRFFYRFSKDMDSKNIRVSEVGTTNLLIASSFNRRGVTVDGTCILKQCSSAREILQQLSASQLDCS